MASASLLLLVLLLLRRRERRDGFFILVAASWYGAGRFLEDFFRVDDEVAFGLSGSQLVAMSLAVGSLVWLVRTNRHNVDAPPEGADGARSSRSTLGRRPLD